MLKKDKQKVFGSDWNEEQLRPFLTATSFDGTDPDYLAIMRAYRHMEPNAFSDYISLFQQEGHNLNATDLAGRTSLSIISQHSSSGEYAQVLTAAGAQ